MRDGEGVDRGYEGGDVDLHYFKILIPDHHEGGRLFSEADMRIAGLLDMSSVLILIVGHGDLEEGFDEAESDQVVAAGCHEGPFSFLLIDRAEEAEVQEILDLMVELFELRSEMQEAFLHSQSQYFVVFVDEQHLEGTLSDEVQLDDDVAELFVREGEVLGGLLEDAEGDVGFDGDGLFEGEDHDLVFVAGNGEVLEVGGPLEGGDGGVGAEALDDLLGFGGVGLEDDDLAFVGAHRHPVHLLLLAVSRVHRHHVLPQQPGRIVHGDFPDVVADVILGLRQ
jgi:hypothetical protein